MDRILALLQRPSGVSLEEFNEQALREIGPACCRSAGIRYVSLHLLDELPGDLVEQEVGDWGLLELSGDDTVATGRGLDALSERVAPHTGHAYRVETRRVKRYARDWPDGARTPGVFMIAPVYRAPALSLAAFDRHWGTVHAPLAVRHHIGMWDYRQNVIREALTPGAPAYDGVAHMGFPSREAFDTGLFDSSEGVTIIMDDTKRFLALDRSQHAIMAEYVLKSE